MRLNLYRGKSTENNEWVYGDLIVNENGRNPYIFSNKYGNVVVDKDTVGECTGLKDKDGNLIFEDDFISWKRENNSNVESILLVEFKFGGFGYTYYEDEFHILGGNSNFTFNPLGYDKRFTIIGNKHNNPELLGKHWIEIKNDGQRNIE